MGILQSSSLKADKQFPLLKSIAGVGAIKGASLLLAVLTTVILGRLLGPSEFGSYSFWIALSSMVCLPLLQGLPTLVIREVARADSAHRAAVTLRITRFSDGLALAVVAFACFTAGMWATAFGGTSLVLPSAAMAFQGVYVAQLVRGAVIRAYGRDAAGQVPSEIVRPATLLLLAGAMWITSRHDAWIALVANVLAALVGLGLAVVLFRQDIVPQRESEGSGGQADWLRSLVPLSAAFGVQVVNGQVDLVALGVLATPSDVGVYKIAATLANQLNLGMLIMSAVATPRFARLYREGSIDDLLALNRMCVKFAFTFGLLVLLMYLALGKFIIALVLGPAYSPAFVPLLILSVATLAATWAGPTNAVLNMMGREKDVLVSAAISFAVNLVLNILLIPKFGIAGAATGIAVSLIVWRICLAYFLRKRVAAHRARHP